MSKLALVVETKYAEQCGVVHVVYWSAAQWVMVCTRSNLFTSFAFVRDLRSFDGRCFSTCLRCVGAVVRSV